MTQQQQVNNGNIWEICVLDDAYEINTEYPYYIRKRSNQRVISEHDNGNGYLRCYMSGRRYYKHRIIAYQWIDNPEDLEFVDHINRDRSDNRVENLRFVSRAENGINLTSYNGIAYTLLDYDEAPEDLIDVNVYNQYDFDNYYYSAETNRFYFDTGVNMRELPIHYSRHGSAFVSARDFNGIYRHIYFTRFRRQYGIEM